MDGSDRLLEFRRAGGRAANDDHLVIDHDGHARLRTPKGSRQFELGPGTVEQLRRELETADLANLPEDLRRPPEADEPQPDVVEYAVTAGGHTVHALGSALPPQLVPVVETLNVVLQREVTGAG
jgi:hypothetical protein